MGETATKTAAMPWYFALLKQLAFASLVGLAVYATAVGWPALSIAFHWAVLAFTALGEVYYLMGR